MSRTPKQGWRALGRDSARVAIGESSPLFGQLLQKASRLPERTMLAFEFHDALMDLR